MSNTSPIGIISPMPNEQFSSCLIKQERIKKNFAACKATGEIYEKIIELGRLLAPFPEEWKTAEHLVSGCQSQVYLYSELVEGKVRFLVGADALISAGLAALLLAVYNDESPEAVLGCPPTFLESLGIPAALTPGRSHGLASIHLRMKQEALRFLVAPR